MNSEPLSVSRPQHGDREPPPDLMEGGGHTAMALPPQRLELDPAGGDIDGAERVQEEAGRALAAVRDEIDLEKARRGVIPLGESAERDLGFEPGPGPGEAGAPAGLGPAGRRQQALQGADAGLPEQGRGWRRHPELAAGGEALQQLGDERLQAFGADLAGRLPEDLRRRRHGRPILPRAPHRATAQWPRACGPELAN